MSNPSGFLASSSVLIESDWNLKEKLDQHEHGFLDVLIESDWNLKSSLKQGYTAHDCRINRIRLEFKERIHSDYKQKHSSY